MSVCVCPRREGANPKCRASVVMENGDLFCAHERVLEGAIVEAVRAVDPQADSGINHADTVMLLRDLRGQGWTIRPPSRRVVQS